MSKTISTAFLLLAVILTGVTASAQTQQGYVKTKGRMVNGQLVPGQGLKGATVSVKGRTVVLVNADDGAFSFPVTEQQFRMDSVNKKGYQLVDMDACPRTYNYSNNPIYIVMETPDQQLQDKLTAERKIRRNLQKQLQEREDEIESLKEQQKISDEEYRLALQKLYQDQESNEQLISDMAKRYSELDYDQLDEFYRQVSYCIENGELVKADSLLNTRGDITTQVGDILQRGQTIMEQDKQLQKAKVVQKADIEEAARRCYSFYETFAAQHMNDTAAYYLELRASLDTTNADWQNDAGEFISDYIADYDRAMVYHQRSLRLTLSKNGEYHEDVASSYNEIGCLFFYQGNYSKSKENLEKSLKIYESLFGDNDLYVANEYNNLSFLYGIQQEYSKALEYLEKSLTIILALCGENIDAANGYNNIGSIYNKQKKYHEALEYHLKALEIRKSIYGEEHPDVAQSYNNIGFVYVYETPHNYDSALEYFNKSLNIFKTVYGEHHPDVALSYNNIGFVLCKQGHYKIALEYLQKALSIRTTVYGNNNLYVAECYDNIGLVYNKQNEFNKAISYYTDALNIYESLFKEKHSKIPYLYGQIGLIYYKQDDYFIALEYFDRAFKIGKTHLGEDHLNTIKAKEYIEKIQAKLKEQDLKHNDKE